VVVPSYTELLVKLIGCVLAEFPEVRTRFVDATTLETVAETSIAVAVDTPQGLLAPVVPRVAERPLAEVVTEVRALAARARAGELGSAELTGGVFTVTNLGALGVEYFTPVLNLPQVAILGVGAILREPVVVDDDIVIADRLPLSLTFDHRLLDGAPAARFLDAVCRAIENPAAWLVG
jgi:pyruvate dehydrogenase E2 component (dihydrolipoamide acetyltransferase)